MRRNVIWTLILIYVLVSAFVVTYAQAFAGGVNACFAASGDTSADSNIILHQDFDKEATGAVPQSWDVLGPQLGNFTVDDEVYYGQSGKSAKLVGNSTEGAPSPCRNFTAQTGTIVAMFAIRLANDTGNNTGLEVYVDDGNFAGANIIFKQDGTIRYRGRDDQLILLRDSCVPDRWYRIKMIMNIPGGVYNIYVDDHIEAVNARLAGAADNISRIIIKETDTAIQRTGQLIGFVDDIEIRRCIEIPEDFPTIQEGIDAASPGDIVYVGKNRVYFENLVIKKTLWLIGEDMNTTVIDGRFVESEGRELNGISIVQSNNVTISGFTINCSAAGGARVYVDGSSNTVSNNIIMFSLGDGVRMVGADNTVANNIVESNLNWGIRVYGSNTTIQNNIVKSNDGGGIYVDGPNCNITDNVIDSNPECGIRLIAGTAYNVVRNNTLRNNAVGLRCDAYTRDNLIYQNRFVNNTIQAMDFGPNKWDDGYPYKPKEQKGGGNYWSDFISIDMYTGVSQDNPGSSYWPNPDGICDTPYNISSNIQDHYPLFLITSVTQNPVPEHVNYNDTVKVTVTPLKGVKIMKAKLYVSYDNGTPVSFAMDISENKVIGTVPSARYGTVVRYNVSILAGGADWLNSTNYPLPRAYNVTDELKPTIYKVWWLLPPPNENRTTTVVANVNDTDTNASGVAKVFLSYEVDGTIWTAEMQKAEDDNYTAIIPKQPGNKNLSFNVTAYDRAGNWADPKVNGTFVKLLAILSVGYGSSQPIDPCEVDLGVLDFSYTGPFVKRDSNLRIYNLGNETLLWNIAVIEDNLGNLTPSWLTIDGLTPITTLPGRSTPVNITIDTSGFKEAGNYVAFISVSANGTIRQWGIDVRVIVRHIIIDESWSSLDITQRADVNSIQTCSFHAEWAHNCSSATGGTIIVNGQNQTINATGWATFSFYYSDPIKKTFSVENVSFSYVYKGTVYAIKTFTQRAHSPIMTWDRVKIILHIVDGFGHLKSGDDAARIDIGSDANILWNASVYTIDNSPFEGYVAFNDTLHHDTVGYYCINTSGIVDTKYHLKAFTSNYVCCVWDRIKIIGKAFSTQETDTGKNEKVWAIAVYDYENQLLKGERGSAPAMGTLYLSVYEYDPWAREHWHLTVSFNPMIWSVENDRWEWNHTFSTTCTRVYKISKVDDYLYNLTKMQDSDDLTTTQDPQGQLDATSNSPFGTIWETPTENQTVNSQSLDSQPIRTQPLLELWPWAIIVIIIPVVIGSTATLALLMRSGKKHSSKSPRH
jgi:parallel beta-helix repeat protein